MKKAGFLESRESISPEQTEEFSRGVLESAQTGIYIVQDGKFVYVNPVFKQTTGYTRKELIGRRSLDLVHPDDGARVREEAIARLKREKTTPYEYRLVRKDGGIRWILEKVSSFQYRGRPATMGNHMDITERKRKEEEVEKGKKFLQNVLATIPDSLLVLDKDLRVKSANRTFYEVFQTEPKKVIGSGIAEVLHDEEGELTNRLTKLAGTEDTLENFEMPFKSEELEGRILNITARGIRLAEEEEEEEEEEVIVMQDITERKQAEEKIQIAEQNFRNSLDNSPLGVRIVTAEGELLYANQAILDIYGYSSVKELKAMPTKQHYTPESYARHWERVKRRNLGEPVPPDYEISIVRKDGEIRCLAVFRKEVMWGGKVQFQAIYQDITERKRAEEAVRESEERYRALVNLGAEVGEAVVMMQDTEQGEGIQTFVSDEWSRITGYSERELLSMSFFDLVHPKHREASLERHQRKIRGEAMPGLFELSIVRKDGAEVPIELTSACTIYKGKRANVVYIRDITERKQAEEVLRESEEKYRTLFEDSRDAVYIFTQDGKLTSANQAFLNLFGYTGEKAIGLDARKIYANSEDRLRFQQEIEQEGVVKDFELKCRNKDGTELDCLLTATTRQSEDGVILGYQGIIRDITKVKQARAQIEASLKEKEVLLREVHHRVKNNLQVIDSLLSLQSSYVIDKQGIEVLKVSRDRVRAMALVHDKLYQSPDLARIDFGKYVREIAEHLIHSYATVPDAITLQVDVEDVSLDADTAVPCGLIINELVTNSHKHAFPEGSKGEIRIELSAQENKEFLLIVGDNGIGFPQDLDFRNTHSLGMQLVANLVGQLRGTINLDRQRGTEWRIRFTPLA